MNRDQFLAELEAEARINLGEELTSALLCELSAHLDESIQARLELGEAPSVAEFNAIASFNTPKHFVRSMSRVHVNQFQHDRPLLLTGLGFALWITFWIYIATKGSFWFGEPLGLLLFLCAFLLRSAQLGSFRWGTMRRLAVAGSILILFVSPLTTLHLGDYGGLGYMSVGMAKAMTDDPAGFVRGAKRNSGENEGFSSVRDSVIWEDVEAAKAALAAPLVERFTTNEVQTFQMFIMFLGLTFVAHCLPVSLRLRFSNRLTRRRSRTA